jgi:folate-binding protein YgfZ
MAEPFQAITGHAATARELVGRGFVRVTGEDRVRFLNGMLTNDVAALGAGQWLPALQLDRKGHVLTDLFVLAEPDALWLDVSPGAEAELVAVLGKHVIADDVLLESHTERLAELALDGPGAAAAARAAGLAVPAASHFERADFAGESLLCVAGGSLAAEGLRVVAPRTLLPALRAKLALPELSAEAAEILRVEAALPLLGRDLGARNFPQEARLERAVSFKKGCYIGQEIVARIASRGAVNRVLVKLATRELVAPGAEIRADGAAIGEVTSSARSPVTGPIALGYVKVASSQPGQSVEVGGVAGEVVAVDSRL